MKTAKILLFLLFFVKIALFSQNVVQNYCKFKNNEFSYFVDTIISFEENCSYFNKTTNCFIVYDILKYSLSESQELKIDTLLVVSTVKKNDIIGTMKMCYYDNYMFVFDLNFITTDSIAEIDDIVFKKNNTSENDLFIIDDSRDIWVFQIKNRILRYKFKSGSCLK